MNRKSQGIICGILAAIFYGTNPLGALNLYADGLNVSTVLTARYGIALVILATILIVRREPLSISLHRELPIVTLLGILFAASSVTLFESFNYMEAGIASTILFVYPIMVALIMTCFFHERVSVITILSIALSLFGIYLLYEGEGGTTLSTTGVLFVIASSLSYAVYIVIVNQAKLTLSSYKLTFWVMIVGLVFLVAYSFIGSGGRLQMLSTARQWSFAFILALMPTVLSLSLLNKAVRLVGSTPSAIMGALEPVTAVVIGIFAFGERITPRRAIGMLLILAGVLLIISGKLLLKKLLASVRTNSSQPE